ncbi:MAG: hypothetical protein AAFY59_06060 [Pseudomonadota bacterium]
MTETTEHIATLKLLARGFLRGARRTSLFWLALGFIGTPFTAGITLIVALCVIGVQFVVGAPAYFLLAAAALQLTRSRTPHALASIALIATGILLLAAAALILPHGPAGTPFTNPLVVLGPAALLTAPVWGHALGQVCSNR